MSESDTEGGLTTDESLTDEGYETDMTIEPQKTPTVNINSYQYISQHINQPINVGGYTMTIQELTNDMLTRMFIIITKILDPRLLGQGNDANKRDKALQYLRRDNLIQGNGNLDREVKNNCRYVLDLMISFMKEHGITVTNKSWKYIIELYLITSYQFVPIGYTGDENVYQSYLSFINNIPTNPIQIDIPFEYIDDIYTEEGNKVDDIIEEIIDEIERENIYTPSPQIVDKKRKLSEDEDEDEDGVATTVKQKIEGGGNKFKNLTKKGYTNTVKPWLDKLQISSEMGEVFNEYLVKTRTLLNITAKVFVPKTKKATELANSDIVKVLKNMMNIITTKYTTKPPYIPPGEDLSEEDLSETVISIYDSFLNNDDGDPYISKIVCDMMSIFMCLVIYCITNNDVKFDEFTIEMRTLYLEKFGSSVENSIKEYRGRQILFEGCTNDTTSPPLFGDNYFNSNSEAIKFVNKFPRMISENQLLSSSNGNNQYSSPLSGGLVALLSQNLDKNKMLKLVCYDTSGSTSNDAIKIQEMKMSGVAPRTCIKVGTDISQVLTDITKDSIPTLNESERSIIQTIISSTTRTEFLDLLLKYSVTREMVINQIENLRTIFGDKFINTVLILRTKIMTFYADAGMCILQSTNKEENTFAGIEEKLSEEMIESKKNSQIYANFIYNNTYDNPDNRSINYKFIYNNIYTKIYNESNVIDSWLFTNTELDLLTTTYIIRTPIASGSSHFQQNWSSSFNKLITECYCKEYSYKGVATNEMGVKVSTFNSEHTHFINSNLNSKIFHTTEEPVFITTYSDKTTTSGRMMHRISPFDMKWLEDRSVVCSFNNFLTYNINSGTNTSIGVCDIDQIFSLRNFVINGFSKDIFHDSKPSATRVNQTNSDAIKYFVNLALNFYNNTEDPFDPIKDILSKSKLPDKDITPHTNRSYEQQCYGKIISDKTYAQMTGTGMSNTVANSILELNGDSVFKYNNAVMKKSKMENSGNSATFIDGGTLKQTENILIPNLCLCILGNEQANSKEIGDKFYIIVSYDCREIVDGIKNIIMRINLIYISNSEETMFVVHEFILGKGVHCKEVYNDLAHSLPIRTRFNGIPFENTISVIFPILFCLKKTCCDLFQNILKCSTHVKNNNQYEIMGFFKQIDKEKLELITNKDIAYTIVVESDFKELLLSNSVDDANIGIFIPKISERINCDDGVSIAYFELFGSMEDRVVLYPIPSPESLTHSLSPPLPPSPVIPNYVDLVQQLSQNYDNPQFMSNIRWFLLNNVINIKTYESLFLSCLYKDQINTIIDSITKKGGTVPVNISYPLLSRHYLILLFWEYNYDNGATEEFTNCIEELQSEQLFIHNRFIEHYRLLFYNLYLFITYSQIVSCTDLRSIDEKINILNKNLNNSVKENDGCIVSSVTLFTYNNILWEFFRPSGDKNKLRNISTISDYSGELPIQLAVTGDILDSLFALMLVSLTLPPSSKMTEEMPGEYITEVIDESPSSKMTEEPLKTKGGKKSKPTMKKYKPKIIHKTKRKRSIYNKKTKTRKYNLKNKMKHKSTRNNK